MNLRRWILSVSVIMIPGLVVWVYLHVDWAAMGAATPPEDTVHVDTELAEVSTLTIGARDALHAPASFTWSQFQPIIVTGRSPCDQVQCRKPGPIGNPSVVRRPEQAGLWRFSVFVRVYRKSSLNPQGTLVSQVGSGVRVDPQGLWTWKGKLWIPHVPGRYLVKVMVLCHRRAPDGPLEQREMTISTFPLEVTPQRD
jgi:hypothetical protein